MHGGGFYEVAKYQAGPEKMPEKLHWFKWEAYTTWITGTALLIWMYYFNAQAYLIDPRIMELSTSQAIGTGIIGVLIGVLIYELLLRSPLARSKAVFIITLTLIGAALFYGFTQMFSGRGAFIHMGVLIGSIMVNNVWHKIIPGQRKMVAQVAAGETIDPAPGLEGKRRSIHNNYFTLPVIFLMISNHYPMIYQHSHNWLVGVLVMVISVWIRHYFNLKHSGQTKPSVLISGAIAMFVLALVLSWPTSKEANAVTKAVTDIPAKELAEPTSDKQHIVQAIITQRCTSCHSTQPTDDVFTVAPGGATFDTWQDIERWRARIIARTVESADMPFMNKTEMTDEERLQLKQLLTP